MKIRLKNTKLMDEHKNPILFFHTSPCKKIERFFPLSHFGTQSAARLRSLHYIYQALGVPEPAVLPQQPPAQLLERYAQLKNVPKLQVYSVYLALKSPLRIPDLTLHSLEQYHNWFSHRYSPKSHFLTGDERCEGDVVGSAKTRYKKVLSDFIFRDPFTRSEEDLRKELSAETFYTAPKELKEPQSIPAFLFPVTPKMNKKLFSLAEKVAFQRMMCYLQGEGYDGFVYQNEYEDKGQNSYVIFRPEQVFNPLENLKEHTICENPEQKAILYDAEFDFFKAYRWASPTQRIQKHLQTLKKNKLNRLNAG